MSPPAWISVRPPRAFQAPGRLAALRRAAREALRAHGLEGKAALTVVLADDETVRRLNRTYRGLDWPTDVLAFPAAHEAAPGVRYLGDVVIAFPYAARQARREGHPLEGELALLAVHGVLHLLGYDHHTPRARRRMWTVQRALLSRLGFAAVAPPP